MDPPFDTLLLKNGGVIQGKIVRDTPDEVQIRWQDGIIGFRRGEIADIKRGDFSPQGEVGVVIPKPKAREDDLEDRTTYPRVYLKNGTIKKGVSIRKDEEGVTLGEKLQEGGEIEFKFKLDQIEKISLWPPLRHESTPDFKSLEKTYPSFRLHEKPHYLILSDDDPIDLNLYLRALEQFYDEFIIYFLDFVKPDYQPRALQAMIFGKKKDFEPLLKSYGFPAKANLLGVFNSVTQILFLYNIKSAEMVSRYLSRSSAAESQLKRKVDSIAESYSQTDEIAQSRVKGMGERLVSEMQRDREKVEGEAEDETVRTIRHEGAHQLLYEFDVYAKNTRQGAWLVEGLASFCEPSSIGDIHEVRLMELKFELETHELMPLEYLLSFAAGADIHRLEPSYASLAYAESWAFVYFLMSGPYRNGFLSYVKEVAKQGKDFDEKQDISLLGKYLEKSTQQIEMEFVPYLTRLIEDHVEDEKYQDFRLRLLLARQNP